MTTAAAPRGEGVPGVAAISRVDGRAAGGDPPPVNRSPQCVLWPAHAIKAKSAAATMARRVGRDEVKAASTVTMVHPNLKAGLIGSSSPVKTSRGRIKPMGLLVDLGKTSCRAVVHGNPVVVPGAPGLAAP